MDTPVVSEQKKIYYWFLIPAIILYTLFFIVPSLGTIYISFFKWAGAGEMKFVGWRNYEYLHYDDSFIMSFINTLKILFIVGGATFLLSFMLTMVLREMAGRKFVRAVVFFPNIVSGVAIAILWGFMFQADGLINQVIMAGTDTTLEEAPKWLREDNMFNIIMIGITWMTTGFYTTILMAGVDRIPKYLYEDCSLAGANEFEKFRYVTLPLMWEVLTMCAILWTISSIKIFEFILAFAGATGFLPPVKVWNTALYAYAEAFAGQASKYGVASASALVMLILTFILVIILRRVLSRKTIQF